METIEVTDIEDEESNGKLRGHLTSPDFFNVNKYPNGKLTVIKSEKIGNNKLKLMATLQLKEISKDIEFEVTMLQEGDKMVAIGQVDINRTEFDIRYGSGSFFDNLGAKAIKDNFKVKFKVAAIKK
jgi:polyisoprenoid-binding protein YceI